MTAWRNRTAAVATALAFALGVVVVPTLHLAFHALPHDHDGGEIHHHVELDDHHHQDHDAAHEDHDHAVETHEDHHHDADHDREPFDPQHGEGSAAHFSLALGDAPASTCDLMLAGVTEQDHIAPPPDVLRASAHVSIARFRGPPVAI